MMFRSGFQPTRGHIGKPLLSNIDFDSILVIQGTGITISGSTK